MEYQEGGRGGTGRRKGLKIPGDELETLEVSGNIELTGPASTAAIPTHLETAESDELRLLRARLELALSTRDKIADLLAAARTMVSLLEIDLPDRTRRIVELGDAIDAMKAAAARA